VMLPSISVTSAPQLSLCKTGYIYLKCNCLLLSFCLGGGHVMYASNQIFCFKNPTIRGLVDVVNSLYYGRINFNFKLISSEIQIRI
jgi:hypothetical protein